MALGVKILLGICLLFGMSAITLAEQFPGCTASQRIQYPKEMHVSEDLDLEQVNRAIRTALGGQYLASKGRWVDEEVKGKWFFEGQREGVIYGGLSVRSHYLQLAIGYDEQTVLSVICDSENLKQSTSSIHRKVPQWKTRLDTRIRRELGLVRSLEELQQPQQVYVRPGESGSPSVVTGLAADLAKLSELRDAGVISEEEFETLKKRAIARAFE